MILQHPENDAQFFEDGFEPDETGLFGFFIVQDRSLSL
jgi:hypothetical protein